MSNVVGVSRSNYKYHEKIRSKHSVCLPEVDADIQKYVVDIQKYVVGFLNAVDIDKGYVYIGVNRKSNKVEGIKLDENLKQAVNDGVAKIRPKNDDSIVVKHFQVIREERTPSCVACCSNNIELTSEKVVIRIQITPHRLESGYATDKGVVWQYKKPNLWQKFANSFGKKYDCFRLIEPRVEFQHTDIPPCGFNTGYIIGCESMHREYKLRVNGLTAINAGDFKDRRLVEKYSCCFLNSKGGELFFGVDDNGRVRGMNPPHNPRWNVDWQVGKVDDAVRNVLPTPSSDLYSVRKIAVDRERDNKWLILVTIHYGVPTAIYKTPSRYCAVLGLNSRAHEIWIRRDTGNPETVLAALMTENQNLIVQSSKIGDIWEKVDDGKVIMKGKIGLNPFKIYIEAISIIWDDEHQVWDIDL